MKAWKDLKSVAVPACLEDRPTDARGYPIPCNVMMPSDPSAPVDFRIIDVERAEQLARKMRCALSGKPLRGDMVFVGGPQSALNGLYLDGPSLPDAAEYALRVCPFLAAPKFGYATAVPGTTVHPEVSTSRPDLFVAVRVNGFARADMPSGAKGFHVAGRQGTTISLWKEGEPYVLDDKDLAQVEIRILAARLASTDIHTFTAHWMYETPISAVTPQQRTWAKTANYVGMYTPSSPTGRAPATRDMLKSWAEKYGDK